MCESVEERVGASLDRRGDNDRNDETVDTDHSSHDGGNVSADHEIGAHHTHGGDTDTRLGSAVRGTKVSKHKCAGGAHEAEEWGRVRAFLQIECQSRTLLRMMRGVPH